MKIEHLKYIMEEHFFFNLGRPNENVGSDKDSLNRLLLMNWWQTSDLLCDWQRDSSSAAQMERDERGLLN